MGYLLDESLMSSATRGVVLRFERTAMHDGHGLRTVVFLKGCPLSCHWCSTPESQKRAPEKGYSSSRCTGCGTCVAACPASALSLQKHTLTVDRTLCSNCFVCVDVCPQGAHKGYGRTMTVGQVVAEICKDEIFFFHSGGGVTVSGGECLLQPDFLVAILKECRQRGIDTAVESSLHSPWSNFERILPYVNTFYFDVKHPDPKEHKRFVGVDNQLILSNIHKLDQVDDQVELYMRIPLIPNVNDSDRVLLEFLSLAAGLEKIRGIEILPYHRLGTGTYELLGRDYPLGDKPSPSPEYIVDRLEFMRKQNPKVPVRAGGGFAL